MGAARAAWGAKKKRKTVPAGSRHREAQSQSGILNVVTCFDDLDSASTPCSLAGSAATTLALRRFGGLAVLLAVLAGGSNSAMTALRRSIRRHSRRRPRSRAGGP